MINPPLAQRHCIALIFISGGAKFEPSLYCMNVLLLQTLIPLLKTELGTSAEQLQKSLGARAVSHFSQID